MTIDVDNIIEKIKNDFPTFDYTDNEFLFLLKLGIRSDNLDIYTKTRKLSMSKLQKVAKKEAKRNGIDADINVVGNNLATFELGREAKRHFAFKNKE